MLKIFDVDHNKVIFRDELRSALTELLESVLNDLPGVRKAFENALI